MATFTGGIWEMDQGETSQRVFTAKDAQTLAAVDITNWSAIRMVIKDRVTDADAAALIVKTLSSGISKLTPLSGEILATINPADTTSFPYLERDYPGEIQGVDGSGNTHKGKFLLRVFPQVVRTNP